MTLPTVAGRASEPVFANLLLNGKFMHLQHYPWSLRDQVSV